MKRHKPHVDSTLSENIYPGPVKGFASLHADIAKNNKNNSGSMIQIHTQKISVIKVSPP